MAQALAALTDHLRCPVCRELFTEPVSLTCQHTFCRECIQQSLNAGCRCCPECRDPVADTHFQINRLIRNMAERLKMEESREETVGARADRLGQEASDDRPSDEDAVAKLCSASNDLSEDITNLMILRDKQHKEIDLAKDAFSFLKSQITSEIDHLIQQLQQRQEEELQKMEAKETAELASMEENLTRIEEALKDSDDKRTCVITALSVPGGDHAFCDLMDAFSRMSVPELLMPLQHSLGLMPNTTESKELDSLLLFLDLEGITKQISMQYYEQGMD